MKVIYSLSFEDFQFLQPPFRLQAGKNPGFRIMMGALAFLAALGLLLVAQGLGLVHAFPGIEAGELSAGLLMLALSAAGALASYFLDKRSVRRALEKYGANIRSTYARIHCPDQRTFEADAGGFVTSCRCGSVRRPWTELTRYSENDRFFLIGTKQDTHIVPKSAFDSPGSVTELRQLVLEKISSDRPFSTPPIEFAYRKEDFRHAQALYLRKGGGWRAWVRPVLVLSFCSFGLAGIWTWGEPREGSLYWTGIVGLVVGIVFLRTFGGKQKHYLGPLRMYFSGDGLHLQDPASQGRTPWDQFLGYLEDRNIFLLYYNPKLYRVIPKRVLERREEEFRTLVETKLPRFNYRKPFPEPRVAVPPA